MQTDIVIVSSPKIQINGPLLALAQLKSAVTKSGFSCKTLDFNAWLYHQTIHTDLGYVWETTDETFSNLKLFEKDLLEQFEALTEKYLETILVPLNPKIIGISGLSSYAWPSIISFCRVLRRNMPNAKILLGGPSISTSYFLTSYFYRMLKKEKLFHHIQKCKNNKSLVDEVLPEEGKNILQFKNHNHKFMHPFYITADFECYIPDAISPNGDAINDIWNIRCLHEYPNREVVIFSRWGNLVYKGNGTDFNGQFNGQDLPDEVLLFKRLGYRPCVAVILFKSVDMVLQGETARGCHVACLSHPAPKDLSDAPGLPDEFASAQEQAADRRAQPLAQADGYAVECRAVVFRVLPRRHQGVEEPCPVEVQG
jgi:gliding motility-associated-like protein